MNTESFEHRKKRMRGLGLDEEQAASSMLDEAAEQSEPEANKVVREPKNEKAMDV